MLSNPTQIKYKLEITKTVLVDACFILFNVLVSSDQDGDSVDIVRNFYGSLSGRGFLDWMSAEEICHVDLILV
jgi:hypothetical protein